MKMKCMALLLLLSWAFTIVRAEDPDRLVSLRDSFEREIERATSPIKRKYLTSLQELKNVYTKAGRLEDALAVDAEIKRMEAAKTQAKAEEGNLQPKDFKNWLKRIRFIEPGSGAQFWVENNALRKLAKNGNNAHIDVEIDLASRTLIFYDGGASNPTKIIVSDDLMSATKRGGSGKEVALQIEDR